MGRRMHILSRSKSFALVPASLLAALALTGTAQAGDDPTGVWLNDTGRGAIEIKSCKSGLCGHVVWVKAGSDTYGCGKQIIGEVKDAGGGTWDGGWIYSPDRKRRFDVEIEPQSDGNLKVTGYAGVRFLSKTMIWKPAPKNLVRCNSEQAALKPSSAEAEAEAPAKPAAKVAKAADPEADTYVPAAAPPKAKAKAKVAPPAEVEEESEVAEAEEESEDSGEEKRFSLEDGIEVGDVFSMKKSGGGKCRIKTPWVDMMVDCER